MTTNSAHTRLRKASTRRGMILPILALTMVAMIGFLALAIDLGMMAIAKTQAQQAADLAALAAARTVNGVSSTNYNQTAATTNAQNVLTYNVVLAQPIQSSQLQLTYGSYDYNQSSQTFSANFPATTGMATSAVSATVTANTLPGAFSSYFGSQFLPTVTATAQAAHRPRDIALVMDLSGSMRFGTLLGFDFYQTSRASNNPDTIYPTFGQYSATGANLDGPSSNQTSASDNYTISPSNSTAANSSYSLTYANNFYQNAAFASPLVRAFDSYTSTDGGSTWTAPTSGTPTLPPNSYATTPGGDVPLFKSGSTTTYATTVSDVLGSSSSNILWELDGYGAYVNGVRDTSGTGSVPKVWTQPDYSNAVCQFDGYTQGPAYYGKTFFLWPPDPRNGAFPSTTATSTLTSYLTGLGMSSTDANTLAGTGSTIAGSNWTTYQGQGTTTGLTNLQTWLTSKGYTSSSTTKVVPGSSSKAPIYYAVCRLFNRAYPAGTANGTFVADWRSRFFGTNNNPTLLDSSYSLDLPGSSTYTINYNAILKWINQAPNPFPSQMRAGRIVYYSSIPTSITGTWPNYGSTDQRFWVEFIDYVLGFRQTSAGVYKDVSDMVGYGSDFSWGTKASTAPPSAPQYMSYTDNPARPQSRYWFGPMMMVDFLHNYNMDCNISNYFFMQPGDSYEAPIYTAKQAYVAAINTMQTNHPNDWVSVVPYSWPRASSTGTGRFNCVRSPLGTNYDYASAALLFPFGTINADGSSNGTEINPYTVDPSTSQTPSSDFMDTPRADGNTCFSMSLMLAYNQFAATPTSDGTLRSYVTSSPITFPSGMAGGLGRKGAQKVVIFETDGLANTYASATLVSAGTYKYYKIRYNMNNPGNSEYPTVSGSSITDTGVETQVYSLVQQLATDYGTSRNPFRLYAIGFGPVFQGTNASLGLTTLQTMQYYAGTQSSASTALPSNQIITGTDAQMSSAMVATFTSILQNGVQIALIK
jgi:Putative Flp pilus-assembly TadE/G-like